MGIEEVIAVAKRRGLSAISITDHDSTAGATRGTIIGKRVGLPVIHGVEISTVDHQRGRKAHLICYLCGIPDRLEGVCRRNTESRKKAAAEMVKKLLRYFPITPEMVFKCAAGSGNVYKQHMMHALMDAGYTDSIYGELYNKLFMPGQGSVIVDTDYEDPREVLELIHSAGGVAVLAHPYEYDSEELMEELASLGLDGIEVYHPEHSEEQTAALFEYAQTNHLLMTGGSDFHGMYSHFAHPLGSVTVENDMAQELLGFKSGRKKAIG